MTMDLALKMIPTGIKFLEIDFFFVRLSVMSLCILLFVYDRNFELHIHHSG